METGPFFQFHFANGYEERDGTLVLDLALSRLETIGEALRAYWKSDWPSDGMAQLTRLHIDPDGKVRSQTFPQASPTNSLHRSAGSAVLSLCLYRQQSADRRIGLQQQSKQVDFETGAVVSHDFAPAGYVGEPLFVPRDAAGAEDDGVVITLVYDAVTERTSIVGLASMDLAGAPLFTARLAHHVPYPLHGTFAPDPL